MGRKLILAIDFNNIFYSSYYSEKLYNSKGMNVNAIRGFFMKLKQLKENYNPDYLVIANDLSRNKTFRRKLYKPYKANRKTHDDDILNQVKYGLEMCALIGLPIINNEEYEADDILGMISKYGTDNDIDVIIVSSDKDLYQLVNERVSILSPRNNKIIDVDYIENTYYLRVSQWIELKMLMGDNGDNIPGIKKVGEVTALKLLYDWNNIENLYNNIKSIKGVLQENLIAGKDQLPLVRDLVTIITDYNIIGLTGEMLLPQEKFEKNVYDMIEMLEIPSLIDVMRYSLMI